MYQHPIFPLIITIFTFFIVIIQSIQSEKILKNRFILSAINIAISAIILFVFDKFILGNEVLEKIYFYYALAIYVFYFIIFISSFKTSTLKANHYQLFVKSIRESKWNAYYVVDKKERIKDMSQSLLDEINFEKEEVINKKLFTILNKSIRVTRYNGVETNNRTLETYYSEYRKKAKVGDSEIEELVILNYEGKEVIFKLVMQPVFVLGRYRGRVVVGEKKTDFDLLGVEKKLNQSNSELESLRLKFIATLEVSKEGLFTIDLDERVIWINDIMVNMLKLPNNVIELDHFRALIHPEDLQTHLALIGELSLSKQQYISKYRILVNNHYIWVEERGKRLFEDKSTASIMGSLNPIKNKHFRSSNIDILDNIKSYNDMLILMNQLISEDKYFYLMLVELNNVPEINSNYGWEVGNMIMAEYISNMKNSFVTENGDIFRISGLVYGVLITDPRKMDLLQKGINNHDTFLNLDMQYGSLSLNLEVFAGISISKEDGVKEEHLYNAAEQALNIAKNPRFTGQGIFYKDLIDE